MHNGIRDANAVLGAGRCGRCRELVSQSVRTAVHEVAVIAVGDGLARVANKTVVGRASLSARPHRCVI